MSDATPSVAPPLQLERVTKRFRQGNQQVEALKDLSLAVARGEFLVGDGGQRVGQEHALARGGRPDPPRRGPHPGRRRRPLGDVRPPADGLPPPPRRVGLPGVQSHPRADGRGKRAAAGPFRRRVGIGGPSREELLVQLGLGPPPPSSRRDERRRAAARGHRPGLGGRSRDHPRRRAHRQPGLGQRTAALPAAPRAGARSTAGRSSS